jgi:hypothetical protein
MLASGLPPPAPPSKGGGKECFHFSPYVGKAALKELGEMPQAEGLEADNAAPDRLSTNPRHTVKLCRVVDRVKALRTSNSAADRPSNIPRKSALIP